MAILRRLLIFLTLLFLAAPIYAQSVTVVDGSQTNIVIVGPNQSTSIGAWVVFRAKFLPELVIFQYSPSGTPLAVNPALRCTLDDQSQNPNDNTKWFPISFSTPNQGANFVLDGGGQAIGGSGSITGSTGQPGIMESGPMPCVSWAIQPAGASGSLSNYKITAVQLAASGDNSFIASNFNGVAGTGTARTTGTGTPCTGAGCVLPLLGPLAVTPFTGNAAVANVNGLPTAMHTGIFALGDALANNTPIPVGDAGTGMVFQQFPYNFNSVTWDRQFYCPTTLVAAPAAIGNTQEIAASGTTKVRICGIVFSATGGANNVSITQGTGVNCATATATILGQENLAANQVIVHSFTNQGALIGIAGDAICVNLSAATAVQVTFIFVQY